MSKENNLTDFLTDVADAIREKKGTTDKINPQDFSDEIKGIKTSSSSIWTGHVDVEGLKAIGWDNEDIAYFQEHGVNWMEEDDELYKVSDDNKALYGVLTADNIQEYKDRIVYLPKIDISKKIYIGGFFRDLKNMVAIPLLDFSHVYTAMNLFNGCHKLTCSPPLHLRKCTILSGVFGDCHSLSYIPYIDVSAATDVSQIFNGCYSLLNIPKLDLRNATKASYSMVGCFSLRAIATTNVVDYGFSECYCLKVAYLKGLNHTINLKRSAILEKKSILYIIENETATEPIVIQLHASAYTRFATDPDIVAALENHPLVSLASA